MHISFSGNYVSGEKCHLKFDTSDMDKTDDEEQLKKKKKKRKVKQYTGYKGKILSRDSDQVGKPRHQLKNSNCEIFFVK